MKLRSLTLLLAAAIFLPTPAQAYHRHHHRIVAQSECGFWQPCEAPTRAAQRFNFSRLHYSSAPIERASRRSEVIGGRPAGCPYEFCGCGASLYLFGRIIPELNLAANWPRKFPRTAPAPGMAAARAHHVMVLVSHVQGDVWLVHDSNSGHHQTRLHERSIAGYAIVNPHA